MDRDGESAHLTVTSSVSFHLGFTLPLALERLYYSLPCLIGSGHDTAPLETTWLGRQAICHALQCGVQIFWSF